MEFPHFSRHVLYGDKRAEKQNEVTTADRDAESIPVSPAHRTGASEGRRFMEGSSKERIDGKDKDREVGNALIQLMLFELRTGDIVRSFP